VPKGRYVPKALLDVRPLNKILTASDDEIDFYARFLLQNVDPINYFCPIKVLNLNTMTPQEFTHHIFSCNHCSASSNHSRHNFVRDQLSKTLRFYSVSNTTEPRDAHIELEDGTIGRPDIRLYLHEPTYIDVATPVDRVDHSNVDSVSSAVKERYQMKLNKYKSEKEFVILPFVISCFGATHPQSIAPFRRYEQEYNLEGLTTDVLQNSIFALLKGMSYGFTVLKSRSSNYAANVNSISNASNGKEQKGKGENKEKEKGNPASGHDMSSQKANQNHLSNAIPKQKHILQGDKNVKDLKEKTQKPVSEKNSDQGEDLERYLVGPSLKEKNPAQKAQSPDVKKQVSREGFSGQRQNDENNNANCGAKNLHPKTTKKK
jgi:hypothetical protein